MMARRVPGVASVEPKLMDDGYLTLRFQDGSFKTPFLDRYVSDGTIKMFAYLVLLYDPSPHPLLCVEEPENQLYPQLMTELAEEFRMYAARGGQVLVSTHSPDFLNSAELDEACWLVKRNGCTEVHRARDNQQISSYVKEGDQLGYLWKQGFFDGVDPQ
nr:AAA family ATPase [Xanthomonas oryzae]